MRLTEVVLLCLLSGSCAFAESAQIIPFDHALDKIMGRSTEVASQNANLSAQRARGVPLRLIYLPNLTVTGSEIRDGSNVSANINKTRQIVGEATLNLFKFGADVKNWQAANADESTQEALLSGVTLRTENTAINALIEVIQRRRETEISQKIVQMESESLELARARYKRGLLPEQEVDKIQIDLENARSRLTGVEIKLSSAQSELEALLGTGLDISSDWPWKERLAKIKAQIETRSIPNVDENERPDVKAALFRAQAENDRYSRNWRQTLPTLDADFIYGYYWRSRRDDSEWTGTLSLTFPLFDRLSAISSTRAQGFARESAELALELSRRQARADWESSQKNFILALDSAISRDRTLATARRLYDDNLKRLQSGRIDANSLNLDLNRLLDAELFAIDGWSTAHRTFSSLCHAQGTLVTHCLEPRP